MFILEFAEYFVTAILGKSFLNIPDRALYTFVFAILEMMRSAPLSICFLFYVPNIILRLSEF